MAKMNVFKALFPENRFVSFALRSGRFAFFSIVADLVKPEHRVVDFGAGRGQLVGSSKGHMRWLTDFRGRCTEVVGTDVDPAVLENPYVHRALLIGEDGATDLPDACADVIVSFAVLEHVADPEAFFREIGRLLKPGGWFCAWTPNKWGYVGIGARLVPSRLHASWLRIFAPNSTRRTQDVFPTLYRVNTKGAVARHADGFDDFSFYYNGAPSYNMGSVLVGRLILLYMILTPPFMSQTLMVFLRKKDEKQMVPGA